MQPAACPRIVVVGGYGAFGARAVERLVRGGGVEVVIAGRSAERARDCAVRFGGDARVLHAQIDAAAPDEAAIRRLGPAVIVNASGPFQAQDYALARAAIAAGAHYVDLADARGFVAGISSLDEAARAAGVLVTSGASSVPALAAAIVDAHARDFERLETIEHAITPANGYDPGVATTASILSGLGQPMRVLQDGAWMSVHGWMGLRRVGVPGLGWRWMCDCDVPDLEIFPARYEGVRTVRFRAGLEVALFQWSLWGLAGLARAGLVRRPERFAPALMGLKRRLRFLGSDAGGMVVRLRGEGRDGRPLARGVTLIARQNQGPYVPVIAAVLVARKLARGELADRGATPCVGMISLEEFEAEVADLEIEVASGEW
jgi:saccharopine dehydrogenase-like NADP-dependent oxidoreductase